MSPHCFAPAKLLPTALGLRRFCRAHYDEYIELRGGKGWRDASAAGGRSRRGGDGGVRAGLRRQSRVSTSIDAAVSSRIRPVWRLLVRDPAEKAKEERALQLNVNRALEAKGYRPRYESPGRTAKEGGSRITQDRQEQRQQDRAREAREKRRREAAAAEKLRRVADLQQKKERDQRDREAAAAEKLRQVAEVQWKRERDQRERVEREARERAQRESRAQRHLRAIERAQRHLPPIERVQRESQAQRSRPVEDVLPTCAWKGCRETELAAPLQTAVGLRRYCRVHYDEYIERRQSRVSRSASAAGGRSRRSGG